MIKKDVRLFLQDMKKDILKKIFNVDNDIFIEKVNPYEREEMLIKKFCDKKIKDF